MSASNTLSITAAAILLLLAACSSLGTYPRASRSLLELTAADAESDPRYPRRQGYFCWENADKVAAGNGECAADSAAAEAALSACIAQLASAAAPARLASAARTELLGCMESAGWRRQLILLMH